MFQISSTDVKTMYEFAHDVARVNELDEQLISKGRTSFPMIKDVETKFEDGTSKSTL